MSEVDPGAPYRHNSIPPSSFVNLQASEIAVLAAAAQILSAYINVGAVNEKTETAMMEKSIELAIRMAQRVDVRVQSGEEGDEK